MKCSNFEVDVNAPPDVMSVMRRKCLAEKLKEDEVQRVFLCGLALDFCMLDTALNAVGVGFVSVRLIMDACRAAHIALPAESKGRALEAPIVAGKFPAALSTFALMEVEGVGLKVDLGKSSCAFEGAGRWADALRVAGLKTEGKLSAAAAVGNIAERKALGVPEQATKIARVQPSEPGAMQSTAWGDFATTSPGAALVALGSFVYMNVVQELLSVKAEHGSGLSGRPRRGRAPPSRRPFRAAGAPRRGRCPVVAARSSSRGWGPGEVLKPASGGKPPVEVKHGAFVFLFHGNPLEHDDRDVIFHVTGVSEFRRSLGAPVVKKGPRAKC